MKSLIILAVLIGSIISLEFDHPCREDVEAKTNFLPFPYSGVWYEIQRTDEPQADCITHHYTINIQEEGFNVIRDGLFEGVYFHEEGTAVIADPEASPVLAILNATLTRLDDEIHEYVYQIVHSDYSNYAITWSCENLEGGRSREEGAILGRTTVFSSRVNTTVNFLVEEMGFIRDDFRTIDHSFETCFLTQELRAAANKK